MRAYALRAAEAGGIIDAGAVGERHNRAHAGRRWLVNAKRVERIWRREGLKVPAKQPKRSRLWLEDSSCIRLRA